VYWLSVMGVHRRTVRQASASAVPPPPRQVYRSRSRPAIDPWVTVIDGWLIADRDAPRKQRHTARTWSTDRGQVVALDDRPAAYRLRVQRSDQTHPLPAIVVASPWWPRPPPQGVAHRRPSVHRDECRIGTRFFFDRLAT